MSDTELRIVHVDTGTEIAIPPGGDYGIRADLSIIAEEMDVERDVNGNLVMVPNPLFRKYRVELTGDSVASPALAGFPSDALFTVEPPARIRHTVLAGGTAVLERTPAAGSIDARAADGSPVAATLTGLTVSAPGAAVVSYRPSLTCALLPGSSFDTDEDEATVGWGLTFEEV